MSEIITFCVDNRDGREFVISQSETVNDFRRHLAKELFDSENYVEISCVMKIPIRGFGKLTLEPGKIPASYNDSKFERFNLTGRTLHVTVEELSTKNSEDSGQKPKWGRKGSYAPPGSSTRKKAPPKDFVFRDEDFPPLGS